MAYSIYMAPEDNNQAVLFEDTSHRKKKKYGKNDVNYNV